MPMMHLGRLELAPLVFAGAALLALNVWMLHCLDSDRYEAFVGGALIQCAVYALAVWLVVSRPPAARRCTSSSLPQSPRERSRCWRRTRFPAISIATSGMVACIGDRSVCHHTTPAGLPLLSTFLPALVSLFEAGMIRSFPRMGVPLMRGRAAAGSSASIAVRPSAVKPALRAEVRRQAIPMVRLGCGSANRSSFSRWSRISTSVAISGISVTP